MKTIVAITIFGACIISMISAINVDANCNAKIQQFKDCHEKIRDQRQNEAKTRDAAIEGCYKASGCTAPPRDQKPNDPDRQKKEACMKDMMIALKAQVQTCVQGKVSGLTLPSDSNRDRKEGDNRGFKGGHGDKGIQQACGTNTGAVATVKACIKKAFTNAQSGQDQEKTRFDNNCKSKAQCDAILGSCKVQLDAAKKAVCECGQQVHGDAAARAKVKAATPSCAGVADPKQRQGGPPKSGKQRSCDDDSGKTDYCKEGYEKFKADRQAKGGQKRPGDDGH